MPKKVKIKLCPVCKSEKIDLFAGGYSGTFYCENCKYHGPIIIEKDVKLPSRRLVNKSVKRST